MLLDLITKDEVDIYTVELSAIIDAFRREAEELERLDLDVATEFLLIAATLVEIKTRRLLPGRAEFDLDEELALFEQRDLLVARLLECRTFQDAAQTLESTMRRALRSAPRTMGPEEPLASLWPDPLDGVTVKQLARVAQRVLNRPPEPQVDRNHITPIRVSVSDIILRASRALRPGETQTFAQLTAGASGRMEVIVWFLALLELYRQEIVDLDQTERFGTLNVTRISEKAPDSGAALARLGGPAEAEHEVLDEDGDDDQTVDVVPDEDV